MSKLKSLKAEFTLIGQLLDLIIHAGDKVKYLRVAVSEREYWIKLPKELRRNLDPAIAPGCWLEISGMQKHCLKTGKLKLKAGSVSLAANPPFPQGVAKPDNPTKVAKATILICHKSTCRQRGGAAICQAIAETLQEQGLADRVQVKKAGCLKQCQKGPNLIILPARAKYSRVDCRQVPSLLEEHFLNEVPVEKGKTPPVVRGSLN